MKKLISFLAVGSMVFSLALVLVNVALADSTIGVNMSTTGTLSTTSTFTVTTTSTTAVRFQNAGGTNLLIFDTTNTRLGVNPGTGLDTKFEVGGTASATNLMVSGAVQLAGNASVAYSRFGTTATNHANYISASNDLLVSGDVEIRGTASFGGAASVSGIFSMNDGRFRPNENSATAFRFQNTAGSTNVLIIDTTSTRVGVAPGTALDTKFEVGGTASATNLMISGAVQFAGNASVAYSRFGTTTTNHANYISAANDLLVSGDVEIRGTASFGGAASVSGIFSMNDGRFRPNANSATAFRFQNTAGTTSVLTIDTTNTRVGVNAGGDVDTTLEVGGTASISDQATFGEDVSVSGRFELTSSAARFGLNAGGFTDTPLEVGGNASVSTLFAVTKTVVGSGTASASAYVAEFVSTGTTSVLFGGSSTTQGTCLQFMNTTGQPVYARIFGTTWTLNQNECR